MINIKNLNVYQHRFKIAIATVMLIILIVGIISNAKSSVTTDNNKQYFLKINQNIDSTLQYRLEHMDSIYLKTNYFDNLDTLDLTDYYDEDGFRVVKTEIVGASFYHYKFDGRKTANGERFSINALTAAHKRLPFNTLIRVTNLRNNKSVILRINDRGPFIKGRELDLTHEASRHLCVRGVLKVKMEILQLNISLL